MITPNYAKFPQLSTERLLLRSLLHTDAGEIFALRSDDKINEYLGRSKAKTIEDARLFIQQIINNVASHESFYWAIELKPETTLAGTFCLWNINKETSQAEVGYELLRQYQRKGIMHEAMKKILSFAFDEMKLKTIVACVHKKNLPSIKLLERNDFMLSQHDEADVNMLYYKLSAESFNASV